MGIRLALGARAAKSWVMSCGGGSHSLVLAFWSVSPERWRSGARFEPDGRSSPRDPLTLATSAVVLALVAAAASLFPALKASRVTPLSR